MWLAATLGTCGVVATIVLMARWPRHPDRAFPCAALAVVIVSLWPAPVWPEWVFFGVLFGAVVVGGLVWTESQYRSGVQMDQILDDMEQQARARRAAADEAQQAAQHTPVHFFKWRRTR